MTGENTTYQPNCPIPLRNYKSVLQAHGGGGSLSDALISSLFIKTFDNEYLNRKHDGAIIPLSDKIRIAVSTDSYVIDPIFFPGGNIGELAVYGTVNDVACCGARPSYISLSFIIEEGFAMDDLQTIVESAKAAADKAGVLIVTGDTKVVERGKADKIFVNTTGIGEVYENVAIDPANAVEGDVIICSGPIAAHGISIMSVRSGLGFETNIESDCQPLNKMIAAVLTQYPDVHVIRDATRGGLASALNEIAHCAGVNMEISDKEIPVAPQVSAACELLGFDPLYVANEGVMLLIVPKEHAEKIVAVLKTYEAGKQASIIGVVTEKSDRPHILLKTEIGSKRIVSMISGEQLPRIC